jgi:hypothetical protein
LAKEAEGSLDCIGLLEWGVRSCPSRVQLVEPAAVSSGGCLNTGRQIVKMVSKRYLLASIATVCFLGAGLQANAATVTYNFTGELDLDATVIGTFFSAQDAGDTFTGTFSYDDATPDFLNGAIPGFAAYQPTGMIETTFSGGTFANTPTPYYQDITAADFNSGNPLSWALYSFNCEAAYCGLGDTGGTFEGSPLTFLFNSIQLIGDGSTAGIAIDPLDLSSYLTSLFFLDAGAEFDPTTGILGSRFNAQGHLTSLNSVSPPAVPLPAALPLLAAGLSAMGFMGWRRKRKANSRTA